MEIKDAALHPAFSAEVAVYTSIASGSHDTNIESYIHAALSFAL